MSAGSSASKKARTWVRNAASSGVYFRSTRDFPLYPYDTRQPRGLFF
jgi:hypothetical protein